MLTQPQPRVLLIEDAPRQGDAMLRWLDDHGILAHHVPTAAAGLQAVATQPPYQAIIANLMPPDLSGEEFAHRLRSPVLVAVSDLDRFSPWHDATLTEAHLARLLYLLQTPRVTIIITSDEPGVHEGHCPELGLRCRAESTVQVLRLLGRVMEERFPSVN